MKEITKSLNNVVTELKQDNKNREQSIHVSYSVVDNEIGNSASKIIYDSHRLQCLVEKRLKN